MASLIKSGMYSVGELVSRVALETGSKESSKTMDAQAILCCGCKLVVLGTPATHKTTLCCVQSNLLIFKLKIFERIKMNGFGISLIFLLIACIFLKNHNKN